MSASSPDRYAVVGHPIAHSKSPAIHAAFARQTGEDVVYERILAPLNDFKEIIRNFRREGGLGANVTLPFKIEAFEIAGSLTDRAREAGAVNTLSFSSSTIAGDNTDGVGFVRDLERLVGRATGVAGLKVLILGAGGAARGVIGPLLSAGVSVTIASRDAGKGQAVAASWPGVASLALAQLTAELQFDIIANATSASLDGSALSIPGSVLTRAGWVYDLAYGSGPAESSTPYLRDARAAGAKRTADGLGMLVEQAAESFWLWRGVRPETEPVLAALRGSAA